jgi:N-hydroxyarylamine O-acetyltransferase
MDVDAYLARIGASRPEHRTAAALADLHEAHLHSVPFENYDIQTGVPISLDVADLFDKIVRRRRGGFCYEVNGLFAALLRELGYVVTLVSAFHLEEDGSRGADFNHLRLLVETPDGPMLADVGNAARMMRPVPLVPGEYGDVQVHRGDDGVWWTAERHADGRWERDWSWTPQPRELADFAGRCHYQQHDPKSHFVPRRLASFPAGDLLLTLLNGLFAETGPDGRHESMLDAEKERAVLAERFGLVIDLPWRELEPLHR